MNDAPGWLSSRLYVVAAQALQLYQVGHEGLPIVSEESRLVRGNLAGLCHGTWHPVSFMPPVAQRFQLDGFARDISCATRRATVGVHAIVLLMAFGLPRLCIAGDINDKGQPEALNSTDLPEILYATGRAVVDVVPGWFFPNIESRRRFPRFGTGDDRRGEAFKGLIYPCRHMAPGRQSRFGTLKNVASAIPP
ncbi:hypothetical protein B0H19DRAFT_1230161 [Mycena capillaripes]|nr:hypothetical protein B0H19DRAFT_1230161 [Mycena capillaripes]